MVNLAESILLRLILVCALAGGAGTALVFLLVKAFS